MCTCSGKAFVCEQWQCLVHIAGMTDLWQCTHACAAARAFGAARAARAEAPRHARSTRARARCKRARRTWERKTQKREQGRVQSLAARVAVGRRALSECMQGRFHKHSFTSRFMELPTRSPTKTCKWLRKRAPCMHSKRCPPSPLACGKSTPRLPEVFSPSAAPPACLRSRADASVLHTRCTHATHATHARLRAHKQQRQQAVLVRTHGTQHCHSAIASHTHCTARCALRATLALPAGCVHCTRVRAPSGVPQEPRRHAVPTKKLCRS